MNMKILYIILVLLVFPIFVFAQSEPEEHDNINDTTEFKKRVLENVEIDLLGSFYKQQGANAAVTGGIGTEELTNIAGNINIAIPLNDDDVLSIDATISAYSSASSSNLNPWSGASGDNNTSSDSRISGTPWVESSGASMEDFWYNVNIGYSHSTDDRNKVFTANISFATEYDYTSIGFGGSYTQLFNKKNTTFSIGGNVFLDKWAPEYPTEIHTYVEEDGDLNADFFEGVAIWDSEGGSINKNGPNAWKPVNNTLIEDEGRNTYALTLSLSQILSSRAQMSVFADVIVQNGWLANPMQRVYFADKDNFFIGDPASIPNYEKTSNLDVFQLADDIERLPSSRIKIPIGLKFNYYINEYIVLKTYYRYYFDDWGINSNTINVELPIKVTDKITIYPNYRFYNQSAADYFAPYEMHNSSSEFYTSDYDLSAFNANQYGFGIKYTDILTKMKVWKIGLKNVSVNYSYYDRSTGLHANIVTCGAKFIID